MRDGGDPVVGAGSRRRPVEVEAEVPQLRAVCQERSTAPSRPTAVKDRSSTAVVTASMAFENSEVLAKRAHAGQVGACMWWWP